MNFCVNCKHFQTSDYEDFCNFSIKATDPVYGIKNVQQFARESRGKLGHCGEEGNHYVERKSLYRKIFFRDSYQFSKKETNGH